MSATNEHPLAELDGILGDIFGHRGPRSTRPAPPSSGAVVSEAAGDPDEVFGFWAGIDRMMSGFASGDPRQLSRSSYVQAGESASGETRWVREGSRAHAQHLEEVQRASAAAKAGTCKPGRCLLANRPGGECTTTKWCA